MNSIMRNFISSRTIIVIAVLALFLVSCVNENQVNTDLCESHYNAMYEDILISEDRLPLYADFEFLSTKSFIHPSHNNCQLSSLESLIDRSKTISKEFKQYRLVEIPFRTNESPCYAVLSRTIEVSDEDITEINLFLVETVEIVSGVTDRKVVTMIPDNKYQLKHKGETLSFINKGIFSGVILFSDLDGTFRDIYVYGGDFYPILNAEVINPVEADVYCHSCFLSVLRGYVTKGGEVGNDNLLIEGSICIGYREEEPDLNDSDENAIGDGNGHGSGYPTDGGPGYSDSNFGDGFDGVGGGGRRDADGGYNGENNGGNDFSGAESLLEQWYQFENGDSFIEGSTPIGIIEDIQRCIVELYSADGGIVTGSGVYQEGTTVFCRAYSDTSYVFDRWVGDFYGCNDLVVCVVDSDVNSTAYFKKLLESGPVRPCLDTLTGIMNPLMEMSLAPSNIWSSNYKGATFGMTRGEKFHNGIDLYAEPGTPIYSMLDGVVNSSVYIVDQPLRSEKYKTINNYPPEYNGDTDGAGNRIYVDTDINGDKLSIGYWHLLSDTPVAINPRTGRPFAPGDIVYQGEIIAYSGRTGNAYNVPFAHLHLLIKKNNKIVDPEFYLNGNLATQGKDKQKYVSSTKISNIKCNEMYDNINSRINIIRY